jgi:molybdate transport system ATP-binding protein
MLDINIRRKQGCFQVNTIFQHESNGATALYGRSGAGKTSVINMVAGLSLPDQGHIIVNGQTLFDSNNSIDVPPEKRQIGYVFQDGRLFPHLTVQANLLYGTKKQRATSNKANVEQVVALLGVEHLLSRRPAKLSGGEKQRVAIGRALLTNPSLLLMDEPLASLDAERKAEVLPFIIRLSRELSVPILYVSHALDEILNLADTLVLMENGQAVAVGAIEDLMGRLDLRQILGHTEEYGAVLTTVVTKHDAASSLTHLGFQGGELKVPFMDHPEGSRIRVRIPARRVAISKVPLSQTSIQNIFPGTITEIAETDGPFTDVAMNIGCRLLARITRHAKTDLDLKPGQQVFALVKSVAVFGAD